MTFHVPNEFRLRNGGPFGGSSEADGNNGAFIFPNGMRAIASDGGGWDHVSVSFVDRCPTWAEMCDVKDTFWDEEDLVVQYHPPKSDYVNCHPYCLHLWRPNQGQPMSAPPAYMVGPKG